MCLGIPGKVAAVYRENDLLMGRIDFGGVIKPACLEHLPETAVGDYVLIHVGFALAKVDEQEARQIFVFLESMNELDELGPASSSESLQVEDPLRPVEANATEGGPAT